MTGLFFAVPFAVLLERIFHAGNTPQYAASLAIFVGAALLWLDSRLVPSWRGLFTRLAEAMVLAGRQVATIGAIIICASLVIGVLAMTGLGVKVTSAILSLSGGAVAGAAAHRPGMPGAGHGGAHHRSYVICVSVAGPALTELGLPPLLAHLFVFWYALLSTITPPVCGGVFIAAGMAGESWIKVALRAMSLGVGLYLIPLAMVARPDIIHLADTPGERWPRPAWSGWGCWRSPMLIARRSPVWRLVLVVAGLAVIFLG